MSMVTELERRALRAGLADEIERQEREDNARGPEPERFVLSRGRWVQAGAVPSLLPPGFVAAGVVGTVAVAEVEADELRARRLMIEAQARFGWGRSL